MFLPHEKCVSMLAFVRTVIVSVCLECDCLEDIITYKQIGVIINISASDRVNVSCIWIVGFSQLFHRFNKFLGDKVSWKFNRLYSTEFILQILTSGGAISVKSSNGGVWLDSIRFSTIKGSSQLSRYVKNCTDSWKNYSHLRGNSYWRSWI